MNKKVFMEKIKNLKNPRLVEKTLDTDLMNVYWVVEADENKHFLLPGVRLSNKEYNRGKIDDYSRREEKTRRKYERWFDEFVNNFTPI